MMKDERITHALSRFENGFNCSQVVLSSFASELALQEEQALRLGSPFGGGIARRGEVCGAVSGALMVLGLKDGNTDPTNKQAKEDTYKLAEEFLRYFELRQGTIHCRDLLQVDISTTEGLEIARSEGLFESRCPQFIQSALEILENMLA